MQKNINKTVLPNGITIITENLKYSPIVSLGIFIKTGTINESEENNGITHLIEHMVFKGTDKRTYYDITYEIESKGGYINAYTSKELTCYYAKVLKENVENTFDILYDISQNPNFDKKELNKEKKVIIDEIYDVKDTAEEYILDLFEEKLYHKSNLKFPVLGKRKNIMSFTQTDLFDYFNKYYVSQNLVIALAGNYEHDKLVDLVSRYTFKEGKKCDNNHLSLPTKKFNIKKEIGYQQTHVQLGTSLPGMLYEKRMALNIISAILGEGSTSLLFQKLREQKGMTYQISSFINSYRDISTFGIYFSTNKKNYQKAIDLVTQELDKLLKNGIDSKNFFRAKDYLKGIYIMQQENFNEKLFRLGNNEYYFNKIIELSETIKQIDNVSIDEVNELLSLFNPDCFSTLILQ